MTQHPTVPGTRLTAWALALACVLTGCSSSSSSSAGAGKDTPPAKVTGAPKEAELATVTLSEEAERRLGVEVVAAKEERLALVRQVAGELVVPPGRTMLLAAPTSGTVTAGPGRLPPVGTPVRRGDVLFRLTPLVPVQRDVLVSYESDAAAAKARYDAARLQLQRAQQLLKDRVGSQRALEQAQQEYDQAQAAYQAAASRLERLRQRPLEADVRVDIAAPDDGVLRQLLVTEGLQVNAGASLAEIANLRSLWIRVPVYAGDAAAVDAAPEVQVSALAPAGQAIVRTARRVTGPPSADPASVSVDLYYEVANGDGVLRPGEKITVSLPLKGAERALVVPVSAVVYDMNGGAWVYTRPTPHQYQRRRIQMIRSSGNLAIVGRGLRPGDMVATVGVAEIFGTEFGAGK